MPGNIIVNPGFIRQFGTITNAAGVLELDALHVAAWGGVTRFVAFDAVSVYFRISIDKHHAATAPDKLWACGSGHPSAIALDESGLWLCWQRHY